MVLSVCWPRGQGSAPGTAREPSNCAPFSCQGSLAALGGGATLDSGSLVAHLEVSAPGKVDGFHLTREGLGAGLPQQRFSAQGRRGNHLLWDDWGDWGRQAEQRARSTRRSAWRLKAPLHLHRPMPVRHDRHEFLPVIQRMVAPAIGVNPIPAIRRPWGIFSLGDRVRTLRLLDFPPLKQPLDHR
jgi:hypothetical protein